MAHRISVWFRNLDRPYSASWNTPDSSILAVRSEHVINLRVLHKNHKRSAKSESNPDIELFFDKVVGAGAVVGKNSGTGGGEFMLFFVPTH